jgi:hypothetical protein
MSSLPEKTCASCGRRITWRKKWARAWNEVRFCSDRCRRTGVRAIDTSLEEAICALLRERARGASIDESEAALKVGGEQGWQALLEPARSAARRLTAQGVLEIVRGGAVVDPSLARGPLRLRLR